jgi:hypothetical protein
MPRSLASCAVNVKIDSTKGGTRDAQYGDATEIASAEHGEKRIERLYVKADGHEAIRFSWWKDGQFTPRPMGIAEHELLVLFEKAIDNGVFSGDFLEGLLKLLAARATFQK